PAEICDPEEMVARAKALSAEMGTHIEPGFDALSFKASRGIEDMYELTYVRKDGSQFPAAVSVTALRDGEGMIIGYLLIGTDNTTRRNLQEERLRLDQRLRDQHFYTRSLIESNIDAMITTDPRGIITDVNNQAQALTECTRDELIGSPFKKHFTDPHRAEGCINLVLGQAKISNYELTARTPGGRAIPVSCNASTFCDRERRLLGVFVAARDVTEAKSLERLLQQKNAELVESSRIKSEFLANMSHELRTPLNAIIGFSEVLRDGLLGEITEEQRGFVGDIFDSGQHLLSLISDILDLSKVESGKMLLDLELVKVSSLFVNCLSIVGEKATSRRITLHMQPMHDLGAVQVDVRKVKQILYNLLSNAVKFTNEGGNVVLNVCRVRRAEVGKLSGPWTGRSLVVDAVVDHQVEEFLQISVTDSGIGISRDGLAQLFEPFSQIDSGLARKYVGTGLGLVMVRLLSELHGGGVAVTSATGEGSCFTVWLPFRGPARHGEA
ncbi:MAG: ATP-binding protein, partial [Polyangiaceae bacterium]